MSEVVPFFISRKLVDILCNAHCPFTYNVQTGAICSPSGDDITPHLLSIYDVVSKVEGEYWRDKVCEAYSVPRDMLFPSGEEKKEKYKIVFDKKPKVYISGPITGRDEKEYKNDFNSTELWLTGLGYDVVNPISDGVVEGWEWSDYMRRDIKKLCGCDYIYLIKGWENSKGCCLEYNIAFQLGLKFLTLDENGVEKIT